MPLQNPDDKTGLVIKYPAELKPKVMDALIKAGGNDPNEVADDRKELLSRNTIVNWVMDAVQRNEISIARRDAETAAKQAALELASEARDHIEIADAAT